MSDSVGEERAATHSATEQDKHLAAMQDLTEAMAASGDTFEERVEPVLATGRKHLNFSSGYIGAASDGVQTVLANSGSVPGIAAGVERPLSDTYCKHTLRGSEIHVIHAASESMSDDQAYDESAPESYVGTVIRANGAVYGTLCFMNNDEPIAKLSDWQHTLLEHLAQWIESEVERELAVDTRDQSQRLLEATFDSPETFIGILEPDGTLVKANELSLEFIDAKPTDVLGEPAWEAAWWNHSDTAQQKCKDAVERASSGETVRFESSHPGADGRQISTSIVVRPVMAADAVEKVIIEATDITDLKQHESKIEFFNSILRHDVLNGMTVINSRAELLTDELSGSQAAHAETILDWGEDIVSLTEKIRTVLSALSADQPIDGQPVQIGPVVDSVLDRVATAGGNHSIETDLDWGISVRAGNLFEDVVKNILLNAVQHAGTNPNIEITTETTDSLVQLRIADDGPGIPPEQREAIFKEGEASSQATGTGFGLFFASVMISNYNGDIWVEDSDLGGSEFVIELPKQL